MVSFSTTSFTFYKYKDQTKLTWLINNEAVDVEAGMLVWVCRLKLLSVTILGSETEKDTLVTIHIHCKIDT